MGTDTPTNEVLSVKLDYIQKDIAVIKSDVKEIKADYVTRREFETNLKDLNEKTETRFKIIEGRTDKLYSIVYWFITSIGGATLLSLLPKIYALLAAPK